MLHCSILHDIFQVWEALKLRRWCWVNQSVWCPQVVGYRLTGRLGKLTTSTDLVLTITKVFLISLLYFFLFLLVAVWLSGNVMVHTNKVWVAVLQAQLVLRWVPICVYTILVFNQAIQVSSAWLSVRGLVTWVLAMVMATAVEETASSV